MEEEKQALHLDLDGKPADIATGDKSSFKDWRRQEKIMLFIAGFDTKVVRMKEAATVKVENLTNSLKNRFLKVKTLEEEYGEKEVGDGQQLVLKDSEDTRELFVSFLYGLDAKTKTLRFDYALFQYKPGCKKDFDNSEQLPQLTEN